MKRLYSFFKEPPTWFLCIFYLSFAVVLIALCCFFASLISPSWIGYVLFLLSAAGLSYFVYTVIYLAPKVKKKVSNALDHRPLASKFVRNERFRTRILGYGSILFDMAYGVLMLVVAIRMRSVWLIMLAAYYILVGAMINNVLIGRQKVASAREAGENTCKLEVSIYRNCAYYMLVLSCLLIGAIVQMGRIEGSKTHVQIVAIATAVYTVLKIVFAVRNIVKARKADDLSVLALRNVKLIEAMVALYVLQTTLLDAFSTEGTQMQWLNVAMAVAIWIWILATGIGMLLTAQKQSGQAKK